MRLGCGLVLFAYVATHLLNHGLGLISLEAMEAGRIWFLAVWRTWPTTVLLYGALLTHLLLAFWALYQRRSLRMHGWEVAQLLLGLAIPLLLAEHILGTRAMHELFGVNDIYAYVLLILWEFAPEKGALQAVTLLVIWTHACIGLHFWLRLKPWYGGAKPLLYALALLVPVLALLGFVEGGRDAAALIGDPLERRRVMAEINWPQEDAAAFRVAGTETVRYGFVALLLLVLAARVLREWLIRMRGMVRISYPEGRVAEILPGHTVLEASRDAGIPHASVCGGRGRCSTCRVRIGAGAADLPPPSEDETRVLRRVGAPPEVRLACQIRPTAALEVTPLLPVTAGPREAQARPGYLGGREQEIAILFADIRAFTELAEEKLPYDVVFVLNRYFAAMGRAVEQSGGHLDKFIGDGVMALFGIDGGAESGCRKALAAARAMAGNLSELNASLARELPEPLRIGIGIHAGPAIIGEMGYGRANSLTAVGDAVNTASRLEALTKEFSVQLIVSEAVARQAGLDLSEFAREQVQIRGRQERMPIRLIPEATALPLEMSAATDS